MEKINAPAWPKHPDGRNKRMGEMTPEEQRVQAKYAAARLEAEFKRPEVQAAVAEVLAIPTSSTARMCYCGAPAGLSCNKSDCPQRAPE